MKEKVRQFESFRSNINLHGTHIEDLVILFGFEGIDYALTTFENLLDFFGNFDFENKKINTTIKYDGAPAVFLWTEFPGLDGPGVSTKGLFNKKPKYATTFEEVDEKFSKNSPGLAKKLKLALEYVEELGIPPGEIWQGDFLFDRDSLSKENIDGKEYITFQPNTILYAVPIDQADKILKAKFGIVFHTRYTGTFDNPKVNYNIDISKLNNSPDVFVTGPYLKPLPFQIDSEFFEKAQNLKSIADNLVNKLAYYDDLYSQFLDNEELKNYVLSYLNSYIRKGQDFSVIDSKTLESSFILWLESKKENLLAQYKTQRKKNEIIAEFETYYSIIKNPKWKSLFILMLELIKTFVSLKNLFIPILNQMGSFETFYRDKDGRIKKTNQEGFFVSDIDGNAVKLVDRSEFSRLNFDNEILKGWKNNMEKRESTKSDTKLNLSRELLSIFEKIPLTPEQKQEIKRIIELAIEKLKLEYVKKPTTLNALTYTVRVPEDADRYEYADLLLKEIKNLDPNANIYIRNKKTVIYNGYIIHVKPKINKKNDPYTTAKQELAFLYALQNYLKTGQKLNLLYNLQNYLNTGTINNENSIIEKLLTVYPELENLEDEKIRNWIKFLEEGPIEIGKFFPRDKNYIFSKSGISSTSIDKDGNNWKINMHGFIASLSKYLGIQQSPSWNPSDIYVHNADKENEIKENLELAVKSSRNKDELITEINNILRTYFESKDLVGISVKLNSNPTLKIFYKPDAYIKEINFARLSYQLNPRFVGKNFIAGTVTMTLYLKYSLFNGKTKDDILFVRTYKGETHEKVTSDIKKPGGYIEGKTPAFIKRFLFTEFGIPTTILDFQLKEIHRNINLLKEVHNYAKTSFLNSLKSNGIITIKGFDQEKVKTYFDQVWPLIEKTSSMSEQEYSPFSETIAQYFTAVQIGYYIALFIKADKLNKLIDLMNKIILSGKKESELNPPYIKTGE